MRPSVVTRMGDHSASRSIRRADIIIKRGKGYGGMKGISTSPEQVAVWVNSFSVCAHFDIAMGHMNNEAWDEQMPHSEVDGEEKNKHTEEGEGRRRLDEADRKKIAVELEKYSHSLNDQQPGVSNICNGQVAPDTVNVQNALAIGSEQSRQFSASLSSEFHKTIKKKVKTMELLKKAVTVKVNVIYDVVTLFSRLLVVGQQRSIDIADLFQFEPSPVPPALIDEYGCLMKGDKAVLVKSLSVSVTTPCAPKVVLVDAGQLLYHVSWPVFGTTGDLAASFGPRLAYYPPVSKRIILFDRYDQDAPSAKDHERTRRGRAKEVRLTPNTVLQGEKLFFKIPRTRICLTTFYAATMNDARAHFYRGHKKPPPVKKLPPSDANLQLHVLRAHLPMLL